MATKEDRNIMELSALEKLPTELQLMILEHLPAKQIQRSRGISSHFRQLLDLPENQRMCTRESVKQSLERLQRRADFYCNFNADAVDSDGFYTAFWDLLKDFTEQRGIDTGLWDSEYPHDMELVSKAWLARKRLGPGYSPTLACLIDLIWLTLTLHISIHGLRHSGSGNTEVTHMIEKAISTYWSHFAPHIGPSSRSDALIQRVRNGILSHATLRTENEYKQHLQARHSACRHNDGGYPVDLDDPFAAMDEDQADLAIAFCLPDVPSWQPVHYCFESVWPPWDLHALRALDPIKKAAMLEDMELRWR